MSFKTVFLAVGAAQDDSEIDRAVTICDALGAHLSVLVVGVAPPPPASPYGVVSNDIWADDIREGQDEVEGRARAIETHLAGTRLSSLVAAQYIDRGTVATLAARFSRYADLTLVTPNAEGFEPLQSWVVNGALFESGRPILLLPKGPVSFPAVKTVVIGWDASVEASKAVRDAIGLMKAAGAVHAVLIDPVPSFEGHGAEPGADLAAYLGRHGIQVTVHRLPKEGKETGELLRRTATDLGADLIVMGGFGHSRLRERIFGGTTTTMLKKVVVPVLMAH
ncbi:MAG TPA: universal stress protein [Amaricoccus sp.]|jgi:nucleotide-binding universal stress UspA family protein|nr:universal stress protein [Amaricoccus sp.]